MLLEYPTRDRLHQLRLTAMIAELDRQIQDPDITTLSFEDRLGLLVDAEWLARSNRQLQRRLREAHLRLAASPENIDWQAPRELPTSALRALFPSRWVSAHQTVSHAAIAAPRGMKMEELCPRTSKSFRRFLATVVPSVGSRIRETV